MEEWGVVEQLEIYFLDVVNPLPIVFLHVYNLLSIASGMSVERLAIAWKGYVKD